MKLEWNCGEGKHKVVEIADSKNQYCKKCGTMVRDYVGEVLTALTSTYNHSTGCSIWPCREK